MQHWLVVVELELKYISANLDYEDYVLRFDLTEF
jgi:hypothetical protein